MKRQQTQYKSPAKPMAGKVVLDTQMRMHARAHLLQMKNQKLIKEQKKLNKERISIDKELERVSKKVEEFSKEECEISNSIQKTVSFEIEQKLYNEEIKFNKFLKDTLDELQNTVSQPPQFDNSLNEEELQQLLDQLIEDNNRIAMNKVTLEKTKHIDRYNNLVAEMSEEAEKHERDAAEAEQEAEKFENSEREANIIDDLLNVRLDNAKARKEKAINNLTLSDMKKKNAIVKREEARARREDAESEREALTAKEQEITQKEEDFVNTISQNPILEEEEEDETEELRSIIKSTRFQRTSQLAPRQKRKSQIDLVMGQYEKVLNSTRRRDKNIHLFNDHINMYKDEELTRWNDQMNSQIQETEDEIRTMKSNKSKEELEQDISRVQKQIEELSEKDAQLRKQIEENGEFKQPDLAAETENDRVIKIPDYETEIDNISREYVYLSGKKAQDTRETARQEVLREIAIGAQDFLNSITVKDQSSSSDSDE